MARTATAHALQVTAALGPNTTVHQVVLTHVSAAQASRDGAPEDTRSDGWWAFDGDGKLAAYRARTTDLSGQVLVEEQYRDAQGALVQRRDGRTRTLISAYTLTAGEVAANFNSAIEGAHDRLTAPDAPAPTDAAGDYIINTAHERQYVDAASYRLVKVEELDDAGNVVMTREFPTLEVIDGDAVPTPAP